MPYLAHAFVDGGYLRRMAWESHRPFADPAALSRHVLHMPAVQSWASSPAESWNIRLARVIYYDARPDGQTDEEIPDVLGRC